MTNGPLVEVRESFELSDFMTSGSFAVTGTGDVPHWFDIVGLAAQTLGAFAGCLSRYIEDETGEGHAVEIDRRMTALWTVYSIRPMGWSPQSAWNPVGGDYRAKDGWIRLHTNHHLEQALSVLQCDQEKDSVAKAVTNWEAEALEDAIVSAGGCAAAMRSIEEWSQHPQGAAVSQAPLVDWENWPAIDDEAGPFTSDLPLKGLRVLDLTRVIAGPSASRFLSLFGADVLRIDPPFWEEPGIAAEMTLGKRCAGLDLRTKTDREVLSTLIQSADVLLHGYRPGALENLGFGPGDLRELNPKLIDVSLCAYGWSGPWSQRRGFDTLVQMSCGMVDHAMAAGEESKPEILPFAILDYSTGFLMAASAVEALRRRKRDGRVMSAKLSLAKTADLLLRTRRNSIDGVEPFAPETKDDLDPWIEQTEWGQAQRLKLPFRIGGLDPKWRYPAGRLRSSPADWSQFVSAVACCGLPIINAKQPDRQLPTNSSKKVQS